MTDNEAKQTGEIAALTLVIRQLLARLSQTEQDAIREFTERRLKLVGNEDIDTKLILTAAAERLNKIFTSATPETAGR